MLDPNRRWAKGAPSLCWGHVLSPSLPPCVKPQGKKKKRRRFHRPSVSFPALDYENKSETSGTAGPCGTWAKSVRQACARDRKMNDENVLTLNCADFPSLLSSHPWVWIPGAGGRVGREPAVPSLWTGVPHFQTCIHTRLDKDLSMWQPGEALPPCSISPRRTLCKSEYHWAWPSRTGGGEQEGLWRANLKPCVACSAIQTVSDPWEEDVA